MNKDLKKLICCLFLPLSLFLTGCEEEDQETLDSAKLKEQCDAGFGYSCYKLAAMNQTKKDIFPNTQPTEPNAEQGASLAMEACKQDEHYGCSLYYNFINEGISEDDAVAQLKESCFEDKDGSFLACSNLLEGKFIISPKEQKDIFERSVSLSVKECDNRNYKSAPACYFASKAYAKDVSRKSTNESLELLHIACELGGNYDICKEAATAHLEGTKRNVNYELYEKSVDKALKRYASLCNAGLGDFCAEFLEKQKKLVTPLYLRGIELAAIVSERPYIPTFTLLLDEYKQFEGPFVKKMEDAISRIAKKGCELGNKKSCKTAKRLK